jgi:hypothetical protein
MVTCYRAPGAMTCAAVQYTGGVANLAELNAFTGGAMVEQHGRSIIVDPSGAVWRWLEPGDWVVRGIGPDWDFYVINNAKFLKLWTPQGAA